MSTVTDLNAVSELQAWYDTDLGQQFLAQERQMIERALLSVQGSRLLQVTLDGRQWLCDSARAQHAVLVAPRVELGMEKRTLIATPEELPVQSAVIDILVLHHAHEFSADPHQVIREAARILRPGGHLIMLGFNPTSWLAMHSQFKRALGAPWSAQFISQHRLSDWFKLLQLTSLGGDSKEFSYPLESYQWRQRVRPVAKIIKALPIKSGNLFTLTARKDVAGLTPLQPQWNRRLLGKLQVIESKATSAGVRRNKS